MGLESDLHHSFGFLQSKTEASHVITRQLTISRHKNLSRYFMSRLRAFNSSDPLIEMALELAPQYSDISLPFHLEGFNSSSPDLLTFI